MSYLEMMSCYALLILANVFLILKEVKKNSIYLVFNLLTIVSYLIYISQFWNSSISSIEYILLNICALYVMGSYYLKKVVKSLNSKKYNYIDKIVIIIFMILLAGIYA